MTTYDNGAFSVEQTRFKLFESSREVDGVKEKLVTALSEDVCVMHTRLLLDGWANGWSESRVVNSGVVGGKL